MRVIGLLPLAAMALVSLIVGFRLLALGRRSGQQPELLIALGLLLAAAVGAPLSALGRAPGLALTPLGSALFACGLAAVQVGIACFTAFTWLVFRRDALWATLLVIGTSGVLGVEWLGLVQASASGPTLEAVLPRTRPWGVAIVGTLALAFAWTGCESFAHHARLRRRLALGLADPVVADRIRLWALASLSTVLLCAVIAGCMLAGLAPLAHGLPLGAIALAAIAASVCWTLAFLPPAGYLAAVRRRCQPV
jgi:hypothetical protein